jgi:FdhD protein
MNQNLGNIVCNQYKNGKNVEMKEQVVIEQPVSITVNAKKWLTFLCTPYNLEALAVGFLYNEGHIQSIEQVKDIFVCENQENVDIWLDHEVEEPLNWMRTSGCGGGYSAAVMEKIKPIEKKSINLSSKEVSNLIKLLFKSQDIYKKTGGIHTSALCDGNKFDILTEDVGRHNTLDKLQGMKLLQGLGQESKIILTTGRVSSEMLQKAVRMDSEMIISRTSPTSLSIDLANKLGITLIGYARGRHFTVYAHFERIHL